MLWIGSFATEEVYTTLCKLGYRNAAAYQSQANIVEGIELITGRRFETLGAAVFPAYPQAKCLFVPSFDFQHADGLSDVLVGFLNIKYLNRLFTIWSLKRATKSWIHKHKNEQLAPDVFVYEMRSACLEAAMLIKHAFPKARVYLLVPDLPRFMTLTQSRIRKLLKSLDWRSIRRTLPNVDRYILYAREMAEYLKLDDGKWMVMEGSVNLREAMEYSGHQQKKRAFMYSGACDIRYGMRLMLDAFDRIEDSNVELWISGTGNAVPLIEERARKDARICYLGFLPSRKELLIKQSEAMAMINMRLPSEEASAYCFPSKLFEYMLSGNPVLSFRIPGIPEEYFDYLLPIDGENPVAMAESMQMVLRMSDEEREVLGNKGYDFVKNRKNHIQQARKIVEIMY